MPEPDGFRILLVGCGEIGSRHLQAVATLPDVQEVDVVDPRPDALAMGRRRLAEMPDRQPSTTYRWLSSLEAASPGGQLCIVATRAEGRCELTRQVTEQLGYTAFLLEKPVGQSVRECESLLDFVRSRGLSVWVNCKTRAYPFHKRVKQFLDPAEPILFTVVGGNHGLANNGIHSVDLFAFYDGANSIERAGSHLDPVLHRTKRGLLDVSGTLLGYTEKGSHLTISYANNHGQSEQIVVTTCRYRCIVDHMQRWAVESDAGSGWSWRPVPFEGNLLISEMTKAFARDVLTRGCCELPTLEESMVAHRFILGELQPHFSRLLERAIELCPVT